MSDSSVPHFVPYLEVFFEDGRRSESDMRYWLGHGDPAQREERAAALQWMMDRDIASRVPVWPFAYVFNADRMEQYRKTYDIAPLPAYARRPRDPVSMEEDAEELAQRMYEAVAPGSLWTAAEHAVQEQWRNGAAKVLREHLYDLFDWA